MKNYYKLLGVSEHASTGEIKRAYHVQVKKYHPDNGKSDYWKQIMLDLNEAYQVLMDEKKRKQYDVQLKLYRMTNQAVETEMQVVEQTNPWEQVNPGEQPNETLQNDELGETEQNQKPKRQGAFASKALIIALLLFAVLTVLSVVKDNFRQVQSVVSQNANSNQKKRNSVEGTLNLYFEAIRQGNEKEANSYCSEEYATFNSRIIALLQSAEENEQYKDVAEEITNYSCTYASMLYNEERTKVIVEVECNNLDAAKWMNDYKQGSTTACEMKEDAYRMTKRVKITLIKSKKGWTISDIASKQRLAYVLVGNLYQL